MIKPELLSPAGNLTKLKIALAYGADAVYAGLGSAFSLRARSAKEFNLESFEEGIKLTHEKGAKFYATLNAFPFNAQLKNLEKHIVNLAQMGVDGFIVASFGVMKLVKELAPNVEIHISTQANIMNYLDASIYEEFGANRIVAARELGLKDLKTIKEKLPNLEIEAFVHGSMCFAYSGRCLISAVQSGRQSNRGACANDCRFPYELYAKNAENNVLFRINEDESGTHIFNSKDLNLISYLDDIMKENCIDSFKIEGRTKSEYYVACTTNAYRMAIDDSFNGKFDAKRYEYELNTLKNRGFTDGYLVSRPYEKNDSQNLETSISDGLAQVHAISEDGEFIDVKFKIIPNETYEILAPKDSKIDEVKNELGEIFEENNKFYLRFNKLIAKNSKEFNEIHSGNVNQIKLPGLLPHFSFLRKELL